MLTGTFWETNGLIIWGIWIMIVAIGTVLLYQSGSLYERPSIRSTILWRAPLVIFMIGIGTPLLIMVLIGVQPPF